MKVLIISPWPLNDVLTQSYVVPYLKYIKHASESYFKSNTQIILCTWEKSCGARQRKIFLSQENLYVSHQPLCLPRTLLTSPRRLWNSIASLSSLIFKSDFDVVHSWCATGAVWGFMISRLTGKPLVLDSFEPHADPMLECGIWSRHSLKYKFLKFLEIKSAKHANACLPVSKYMHEYVKKSYGFQLSIPSAIKPACVPDSYFKTKLCINKYLTKESPIRAIYIGKFGGLYLDEGFFKIAQCCFDIWADNFSLTILSCQDYEQIEQFANNADFDLSKALVQCVPHADIPYFLENSDFAILPLKSVPSRLCCTPVKTGEYWSHGLPILATKGISNDSEIIEKNDIGAVMNDITEDSIRSSLKRIGQLVSLRRSGCEISEKIQQIGLRERGFHIAQSSYMSIYKSLEVSLKYRHQ